MRKTDLKSNAIFTAKRVAVDATFLALALIVSLIESMIPPIVPALPYAKIGIGNVVLLACFLLVGTLDGYVVLVLRCLLTAVFSANMASLAWSLPSALAAYLVMTLLYKTKLFSVCGVSVVGGIVHNLMQICVASLIVGKSVFVYLPYMMLAGAIAGIVTGLVCYFIVKSLGDRFLENSKRNRTPDNRAVKKTKSQRILPLGTESKQITNSIGEAKRAIQTIRTPKND